VFQKTKSTNVHLFRTLAEILWICLGIALVLTIAGATRGQTSVSMLDLVLVTGRDKVERNDPVDIYLSLSNKSQFPLTVYRLSILGDAFENEKLPNPPILLSPYGSSQTRITLKANDKAKFGVNRLMLVVDFNWSEGGKESASAQTAAITLEVTRKFEEEAKGFPGGTAAFLYLLLPIIPAFLSYQVVEQLRTGKDLEFPKFETAYIVPAFFAAIILSFLMLWLARGDVGVDYSNPKIFATVLVGSLVLGALFPSVHWGWNLVQSVRWAFSPKDSMARYLEKALLGPGATARFKWVKGKSNEENWEGFLLEQPNTAKVLGASLQASPKNHPDRRMRNKALKDLKAVLDDTGNVKNARRLVEMAKAGEVTLAYLDKIKRSDNPLDTVVVVDEISNFEEIAVETKPLVRLVG
jgi:hypothetical protein